MEITNMYCLIAMIVNLILLAAPGAEGVKAPQARDAKTIVWQSTDSDGTKWAVLEGHSEAVGEAPWHTHHPEEHEHR
jgi:hypothetical protein